MAGVGVGAGVGKILSTPTPARSRRVSPSKDNPFGRMVNHRLENIERQEEKECASVKIKLERHLVVEFNLKKNIGYNFTAIAILL